MPTKRRVLETLSLKELQDLASTYDLEVDDRRVRDQLIEAAGLLSGALRVGNLT